MDVAGLSCILLFYNKKFMLSYDMDVAGLSCIDYDFSTCWQEILQGDGMNKAL